ncbi:hypothetical protein C8R46DRAFT_1235455 [Mycena filopes]|nr:hypothetical protein C8R46DRAFT_1235455 [Mycena filopes]
MDNSTVISYFTATVTAAAVVAAHNTDSNLPAYVHDDITLPTAPLQMNISINSGHETGGSAALSDDDNEMPELQAVTDSEDSDSDSDDSDNDNSQDHNDADTENLSGISNIRTPSHIRSLLILLLSPLHVVPLSLRLPSRGSPRLTAEMGVFHLRVGQEASRRVAPTPLRCPSGTEMEKAMSLTLRLIRLIVVDALGVRLDLRPTTKAEAAKAADAPRDGRPQVGICYLIPQTDGGVNILPAIIVAMSEDTITLDWFEGIYDDLPEAATKGVTIPCTQFTKLVKIVKSN